MAPGSAGKACVKTLVPYGTAEQLEIEGCATFSEEQAELSQKAVDNLMRRLIDQTLDSGKQLAICGHRPVLPAMLTAIDITAMPLKSGACVVAHLDPSRRTIAVEHHPPRL